MNETFHFFFHAVGNWFKRYQRLTALQWPFMLGLIFEHSDFVIFRTFLKVVRSFSSTTWQFLCPLRLAFNVFDEASSNWPELNLATLQLLLNFLESEWETAYQQLQLPLPEFHRFFDGGTLIFRLPFGRSSCYLPSAIDCCT